MPLPPDFQFSQSSLQDFTDCARRFELRYVRRLRWPAVEAEPILEHERRMVQGDTFHRIVHQHLSGVPADLLVQTISDETVHGWWDNYSRGGLVGLPEKRYSEITLSAPFGKYRLLAKYDLLAIDSGQRAVIVDWKTTDRRPSQSKLLAQLQTIVYRYVLVRAGAFLNSDEPFQPEQVEMVYWFTGHPDKPERFAYNSVQFERDGEFLTTLLADIERRGEGQFELTPDITRCRFCTYRSLCNRGVKAGDFLDDEAQLESDGNILLDFDFDEIAEIEF